MTAFQKSKCFALAFSIFFPGVVLAAPDSLVKSTDISLSSPNLLVDKLKVDVPIIFYCLNRQNRPK